MKKKLSARKIFADKMRTQRLKLCISQEQLAELASLHRTYVGSVERAERNISIDNMERIATALEMPLPKLLEDFRR